MYLYDDEYLPYHMDIYVGLPYQMEVFMQVPPGGTKVASKAVYIYLATSLMLSINKKASNSSIMAMSVLQGFMQHLFTL